jgi:hypothetical protein
VIGAQLYVAAWQSHPVAAHLSISFCLCTDTNVHTSKPSHGLQTKHMPRYSNIFETI